MSDKINQSLQGAPKGVRPRRPQYPSAITLERSRLHLMLVRFLARKERMEYSAWDEVPLLPDDQPGMYQKRKALELLKTPKPRMAFACLTDIASGSSSFAFSYKKRKLIDNSEACNSPFSTFDHRSLDLETM